MKHSIYMNCDACHMWGIPLPENNHTCGNCGSTDTVIYISRDDARALLSTRYVTEAMLEQALEVLETVYLGKDDEIVRKMVQDYLFKLDLPCLEKVEARAKVSSEKWGRGWRGVV